jgi:hypothetical protein
MRLPAVSQDLPFVKAGTSNAVWNEPDISLVAAAVLEAVPQSCLGSVITA